MRSFRPSSVILAGGILLAGIAVATAARSAYGFGPARPLGAENVAEIRIAEFAFGTPELKVKAGTRVRWLNGDQVEHSVTAEGGAFDSNLIAPGKVFERVFDKAGSYAYFCEPHPFMKGKVVVE